MTSFAASAALRRALPDSAVSAEDEAWARWLRTAQRTVEAPLAVRVVAGAGARGTELAAALAAATSWDCEAVDADELPPTTVPDVEVFAFCTAPCAHESAWLHRGRRHAAVCVVTKSGRWIGAAALREAAKNRPAAAGANDMPALASHVVPEWTRGMVLLGDVPADPREVAADPGFAELLGLLRQVEVQSVRVRVACVAARLERDCDALARRNAAELLLAELTELLDASPPVAASAASARSRAL